MIIFKTDFKPNGFDRPVTGALKDEIRSKLNIAGVASLTVVFQKGPHGDLILCFEGQDEEVAKAQVACDKIGGRSIPPAGNPDSLTYSSSGEGSVFG